MKGTNVNKPGYKQTKIGWIPRDWMATTFAKSTRIGEGQADPKKEANRELPHIGPENIQSETGQISGVRTCAEIGLISGKYCFDQEAVVYSKIRPHLNKVCAPDFSGLCSADCYAIWPREHLLRQYLVAYMLSDTFLSQAVPVSRRTGMPKINRPDLFALQIILPPLPEQQKIAEILSTWGVAVEKAGALIEAKRQQKKALMRQLLAGKRRLPGFDGKWLPKRLSALVERIKETTENPKQYPVLSITAGTGFVSQADKFSRVIAGKHIEKYILLRRGEFAYNKGNSYRFPQGCVYQLHEYDEGLVPSVFYSFRIKTKIVHDAFLKHYFLAGLHNAQLYQWVNTGVRNNGLLNLNAADFFKMRFELPALEEQRAIAAVLDTADKEIALLEEKLEAIRQQKKGLMQRLLTGQVRVRV